MGNMRIYAVVTPRTYRVRLVYNDDTNYAENYYAEYNKYNEFLNLNVFHGNREFKGWGFVDEGKVVLVTDEKGLNDSHNKINNATLVPSWEKAYVNYIISNDNLKVYATEDLYLAIILTDSEGNIITHARIGGNAEEFRPMASGSFGAEGLTFSIEAADGSPLINGQTTDIVVVVTDAANNRKVSDVIKNITVIN